MKNQRVRRVTMAAVLGAIALAAVALNVAAQEDKVMGKMSKHDNPTVAIIRADWCTACQKLEPTMAELMEQYKEHINFVVLDVTTDEKAAESAATARKLGFGKFFEANKKKTSTVAVFGAKNKVLFQTNHNYDRAAYVRAFDDAVAKASSMKRG